LVDCLNWRIQNHIDDILAVRFRGQLQVEAKVPVHVSDLKNRPGAQARLGEARASSFYSSSTLQRDGHPVFAIGVGLSTYDKASVSYYVQSHIQMNEYRDRVILVSYNLKSSLPSSNQR
ncbi:hypothetical protein BHM03_00044218, partial [Ensete ventricosum]